MKLTNNLRRILSALLVFVLVFTMLPVTTLAADASRENDTIFFATDLHNETSKLKMSNYYLRYSGGKISLNSRSTTTYFFIEE